MGYSQEIMDKVCTDSCYTKKGNSPGWHLDPATGHWVRACGKPALQGVILECDICFEPFVPKFYDKVKNRELGALCDVCDPPL